MLEKLTDLPPGVHGVRAVGTVSKEDYQRVLEPLLDEARSAGTRIRFLYQAGPEFDGFTVGAAWEDAKVGLQFLRLFDGCAIVTDARWLGEAAQAAAFLMPCPVRTFAVGNRAAAVDWLRDLPEQASIVTRLLADRGVIVLEVTQALRAQDFDAVALAVDPWIEAHGDLRGLVIHAREFPGWENVGSMFRHLRFVRDHHRHIKRIALAAGGTLANLLPQIGARIVQAEVERFEYDDLEGAIAWAAVSA